ncbi:MAG: carbohydrate kinase family protein [Candidatus Uhrbacteria bacterium]|nr:carbohydrate kinase family protein [Patescibacteria group bacterium]MBU1906559.1 carbohydrate kinase family protein [Patescibacteria group bacterium]
MFDVITIGDIKLDTFITIPDASASCSLKKRECLLCMKHGAKIPVTDFVAQIAGSAPNVAVGLSRTGFNAAIYSVMGEDETTDMAFKKLGQEGVDTRYIETVHNKPSSFSAVLNYKGERTILASHQPYQYHLPRIQPTKWLFVGELGDRYEMMYRKVIPYVKKHKTKLSFNPGAIQLQENKKILYELIKVTSILFVNTEEAEMLVSNHNRNKKKLEYLIHKLWKMGPEIVCITDGKRGSFAFDGTDVWKCPIFPAKRVEMTGAGDSFGVGFLSAIIKGKKISEALRWGNVNSASVIGKVGPQQGLLRIGQIQARLKKFSNIKANIT